ncbi:HAD family hydrolase [Nanoarchaeota archaeon]
MAKGKIEAVFLDIDDTVLDTSGMVDSTRRAASYEIYNKKIFKDKTADQIYNDYLKLVVKYGPNYENHFSALCEEYGIKLDPRVIALGRIGYHTAKISALKELPGTRETLVYLTSKNIKLAVISYGREDRQWEKIFRLGIDCFFDHDNVYISDIDNKGPNKGSLIKKALKNMNVNPKKTLMVGNKLDTDIYYGNKEDLITVLMLHGKYQDERPKNDLQKPDFTMSEISELIEITENL